MLSDRGILLYPMLLAAVPTLHLYAVNEGAAVSFSEFIVTFFAVMLLTAICLFLARLIIRDSVKAALIVSILLLVFFAYEAVRAFLLQAQITVVGESLSRHEFLLPASAVILTICIGAVVWSRKDMAPVMRAVAVGALVIVLFNGGRVVVSTVDGSGPIDSSANNLPSASQASGHPSRNENLPDIYYIILDGYGSSEVLKEIHGFDNSKFILTLEKMGFSVVRGAKSNYTNTEFSISSSLQMKYLTTERPPHFRFYDNDLFNFVKSRGYTYVHVVVNDGGFYRNPYADLEFVDDRLARFLLSDNTATLLKSTILPVIARRVGIDVFAPFALAGSRIFNNHIEYVAQVPSIPEPTFTFWHSIPPHPPFIFDRDGTPPSDTVYDLQDPQGKYASKPYTDEIFYLNTRIIELVKQILESASSDPVIIIQGDHGPALLTPFRYDKAKSAYDKAKSALATFERTGILNAYYFPEYCREAPYPGITPVNTFRLVFNACLNGEFDLLEDKSYWSEFSGKLSRPDTWDTRLTPIDFFKKVDD